MVLFCEGYLTTSVWKATNTASKDRVSDNWEIVNDLGVVKGPW